MRTSAVLGLQFIIRPSNAYSTEGSIFMRLVYQGKRIEISMNTTIHLIDWIKDKSKLRENNTQNKSINYYLDQAKSKMWSIFQDARISEPVIDLQMLKNRYLGISEKEKSLLDAFAYHYKTQSGILKKGTLKNYRTTERYVKEFISQEKKRQDFPLSKINYQFIIEFEYFLRAYTPKEHIKKLGQNGLMKHMERLQKVLNFVHKLDWMTEKPMEKFSLKFEKTERGYLSDEELDILENAELDSQRLDKTRDLFIFSCYTGLSYIDMYLLSTDHITRGIDGNFWIQTQREKSSEKVIVPLLPKALELIKKYSNDASAIRQGSVFPPISNQKINAYLKELATAQTGVDSTGWPDYCGFLQAIAIIFLPDQSTQFKAFDANLIVPYINSRNTNDVFIYPNPGQNEINIVSNKWNIIRITFCDLSGKIYKDIELPGEEFQDHHTLSVSDWLPGIYLIKARTTSGEILLNKWIKN